MEKQPRRKSIEWDIIVAKNYLQEKEIQQLERTVTAYFDYIEGLIERENTFTMEGLAESVNKFMTFNEYKVLSGKVSNLNLEGQDQTSKKMLVHFSVAG